METESTTKAKEVFGDYELEEEIARGGMGVVYRARQLSLGRTVALKMILYGRFASEDYSKRLRAEASAAASLRHPNIVSIYEVGEHEGQPFLAMEYVSGQSLAEMVRAQPLPAVQAGRYLEAVARAIYAAHQQRVLHRDLKPSNVLIDSEDQPRVTDFGLARKLDLDSDLTISGQPLGTPGYMPPEQVAVKRNEVGPWSDIYSLGAILYHLLTGRPPFLAETLAQTFAQILNDEPVPPRLLNSAVPRDLETICLKCLEKEPAKRYSSAAALADELGRFRLKEPIHARPATPVEKAWRWCQRRPALASVLAGSSLAILLALLISVWQWRRAEAANLRAQSALHFTELQLAEADLQSEHVLDGLSAMARVVRQNPFHRVAVNRLFSALNDRTFVRPLSQPIHEGEIVWSADVSSDEKRLVTTTDTREAFVWSLEELGVPPSGGSRTFGVPASAGQEDVKMEAPKIPEPPKGGTPNSLQPPEGGTPNTPNRPKLRHRLPHPDRVYLARFSPDGRLIATICADQRLRLWTAASGELSANPMVHEGEILAVRFRPDGRELLSAQVDGSLRLWNVASGEKRLTLPRPTNSPPDAYKMAASVRIHDHAPIAFSPDGKRILSVANASSARIWDVESGKLELELPHGEWVPMAEFSSDGRRVVTASYDKTVKVWDARTGAVVTAFTALSTLPIQAHFTPDGSNVVAGFFDNTVRIWDAESGRAVGTPLQHKHNVDAVTFSPDGQFMLAAVHDGTARIWETATGRPVADPVRAGTSLRAAKFLNNGRIFLTRGAGGLRLWRLDQSVRSASIFPVGGDVRSVQFLENSESRAELWSEPRKRGTPNDRLTESAHQILTVDFGFVGRVWDVATGHPLTPPLSETGQRFDRVNTFDTFPIRSEAAALAWERSRGRQITEFLKQGETLLTFANSFDGRRLALGFLQGGGRIIDLSQPVPKVTELNHAIPSAATEFSRDGQRIISASSDGVVRLWDTSTGQPVSPALTHPGQVVGHSLSADGRRLVTRGWFPGAYLWDLREKNPSSRLLPHDSEVLDARFDARGERVVTASYDYTARIWDTLTAQPVGRTLRHQGDVRSAAFAPDGGRVATVSADGTARLWDSATGLPLAEPLRHSGMLNCLDISSDGQRLLCGSVDGKAYLWEIPETPVPAPSWLPELAEALAGTRLSDDGVSETLPPNALEVVEEKLHSQSSNDFYSRWAKQRFRIDKVVNRPSPVSGIQ